MWAPPHFGLIAACMFLLCCALPLAGARKKLRAGQQQHHHHLQAQQRRQDHIPVTLVPASGNEGGGGGGGATVHHLFATPLYVADLADSVDAAALSSLALGGYASVERSLSLQKAMIDLRLAMEGAASPAVVAQLNDNAVFTTNDKFFYYQVRTLRRRRKKRKEKAKRKEKGGGRCKERKVKYLIIVFIGIHPVTLQRPQCTTQMGNAAKCARGPAPECGGVRWDDFFDSHPLRQLEAAIAEAVPRYFATVGVRR
eukprot:SAG11_NODE_1776_length_4265_cov_3.210274_3_plen_255_part_00